MNVKTQFSIKDLENLSGVKAHTIRIWEKRYNLLQPDRSQTNIRSYDLENLKYLLNIAFLYHSGLKISKLADLDSQEITTLITEHVGANKEAYYIKIFKTAMFEFDNHLFSETYRELAVKKTFREIFTTIFIPLLTEIGLLWQTGTIDPIHESFISESVKQKIILNIEYELQNDSPRKDLSFALFLPYQEVHDISLMYANYELTKAGIRTIYLGANIPMDNLKNLLKHQQKLIFLTYLTVQPERKSTRDFLTEFMETMCSERMCELWVMGPKIRDFKNFKTPANIRLIDSIDGFIASIEMIKNS